MPPGSPSVDRDPVRLALRGCPRGRCRSRRPPAPARPSSTNGQRPRCDEHDHAAQRAGGQRARRRRRGRSPAPQRWRSTGLPSVPTIEPTSTSVWSVVAQAAGAGEPSAPRNGMPCSDRRRARRGDVERRREDVRVRDGGDGDRVGRGSRRAGRAGAEVVAVVAGGDHRDDACGGDVVDRLDQRVVRRIDLRAAAGEVDHVHAVARRRPRTRR